MAKPLRSALLATGLLATGVAAGCGARPERTALAVERARRDGATVVVETECSKKVEAKGAPDRADPSLYRVTIYGEPTMGRCHPELRLPMPAGATKLLDETTSQVVDLPSR